MVDFGDFFIETRQNRRIGSAESNATRASQKAESLDKRVEYLEERLDRLSLISLALWTLLKDRGLTEQQLMERVQELDMRDGELDGRVKSGLINCPQCGRPLSQRHRTCLYCEFKLVADEAFDGVVR